MLPSSGLQGLPPPRAPRLRTPCLANHLSPRHQALHRPPRTLLPKNSESMSPTLWSILRRFFSLRGQYRACRNVTPSPLVWVASASILRFHGADRIRVREPFRDFTRRPPLPARRPPLLPFPNPVVALPFCPAFLCTPYPA